MAHQCHNLTLDSNLRTFNAQAIASATTTNGTSIDLTGATDAYAKFAVVIDWSALDVTTGDETYRFQVQGSTATGFSTKYVLMEKLLGDTSVTLNAVDSPATGRTVIFCDNVAHTSASDGNTMAALRWIRLSCISSGTTPIITVTAHIVPMP